MLTNLKILLACLLSTTLLLGCWSAPEQNQSHLLPGGKDTKELPNLTVGIQVSPAMALVMVAKEEGFFEKAGVNVDIQEFTAGKFALQAFLGGSIEVAVSGEVPVSLSTLQGNKFRVIAQVVERTINEVRVVARKDGDLDTPEMYFTKQRRKLATSFGGGPEFFTYEFLKAHGLKMDDVELISQKPEDMPASLLSGSVDAISIFDPFAWIAEHQMGTSGITFTDSNIYSELYVVDVMQKTIDTKRDVLLAFLRGLYDAQAFIHDKPDAAKNIVIKYTKLEREIVDGIWGNFVFKPTINNLFVEYTTAEAKWAVEKGAYPKDTHIPDFKAVLFPDLLYSIDPSAVSEGL